MAIGRYNQRGAHFRTPGGDAERELSAKYRSWSRQIALEHRLRRGFLEQIARTYDRDAEWHDTDANFRKRGLCGSARERRAAWKRTAQGRP
jgi:hypothetical protein